jgi:uncharacterized protein YabE (DUF348 family)
LRIRQATRAVTCATVIAVAALSYLAISKQVTLVVDGRPEAVRTMSANVAGLLEGEGISLTQGQFVEPPPATELADGMTVVVDSTVAGQTSGVGVWVVEEARWPQKIAGGLVEAASSATSGDGLSSVVAVRAVVMGKVHDVLTNAATTGELLSAMGITPDADDRVQPSPSTPLHVGARIRFDRVRVFTKGVNEPIPFTTGTSYSNGLTPGETKIVQSGVDGVLHTTYRIKVVNGKVVTKVVLGREVLREAVPQKKVVGRAQPGGAGSQVGEASWYDTPWTGMTAAHPWLPFGTHVTVTNLATGESVVVVINDRGPFGGRVIDLSPEAFAALAPLGQGVMQVRLTW